ncbi:MAG: phosphoribosylanthranilate isomerase, partial [Planctomycetes bacterium]|nr:phosphoribosylanthranilate isomerase [Planctomycetota bacterium]
RTVQLYGSATGTSLASFPHGRLNPIIVHTVGPDSFPGDLQDRLANFTTTPPAILLDTHDPDQLGGTGKTFDWGFLRRSMDENDANSWPPMILAGGLHPSNVEEAIRIARPWAVDVSSGVEKSPGVKSPELMREFVRAAKA